MKASNMIRSHWSDGEETVKSLTNSLQSILNKLSDEDAKKLDNIIELAYDAGVSSEAEINAGEDI
jgi:hypothetical protein